MPTPSLAFRELEPRIAFDGAIFTTGAEVVSEPVPSDHGASGASINDRDSRTVDGIGSQASGSSTEATAKSQVVFVDAAIADFQAYLPHDRASMEIIVLDGMRDGVAQIADALANRTDIDAIHIISHGAEAELQLGTASLTHSSMQSVYAEQLSLIGDALAEDGDILIYGCDFGGGDVGQAAVDRLAELTGADIAASDDATGADALGGDWVLERSAGAIETASIAAQSASVESWNGRLDITTGLVAHYTFDDGSGTTAADSSGNGNDGTVIGSPDWAAGQVGSGSLDFNKDFDRVEIASNAATDFGTGDFSVGVWFNSSDTSAGQHRLVGDGDGTGNGFIIYRDGPNLYASVGGTIGLTYVASSGLFDGNWHHIVLVREGSVITLYADGIAVDTDTLALGDVNTSNTLRIGASSASTNEFDGRIDEVRLYNRALSADDATELFTDGGGVQSYPSSSGSNNSLEWITNVSFAGINNTSGADAGGYGDYTAQSASVVAGTSNNLSVTINPVNAEYISAWIDWNQDFDFDDPGEAFTVATSTSSSGPHTVSVAAPADAVIGDTRMRVSLVYNQTPVPTGTFAFGEVEDYTVSVTAPNAAPAITSNGGGATANVNVAENTTAVTTVTSSDVDGGTPTYSIIGGADAALFSINGTTGALSFLAAPDFESPGDVGTNNVYDVTVQVADGNGGTDTQAIAVTVTNANEAPAITSNGGGATANVNVAENTTAVTTVTSSDVDGGTPTYSIIGGADAALFSINATTGALSFLAAPDFESPSDAGTNNVYDVTVQVADGNGGTDTQAIAVTVGDVDEFDVGAIVDTNAAANTIAENSAAGMTVGIAAFASDADGTNSTITYTLDDDAGGRFTIDSATGVVSVANGLLLDREAASFHAITVRATSLDGSSTTEGFVINLSDVDEFNVGAISDTDPTANSIAENAASGMVVGIAAFASDQDATLNSVSYSLDDDAGGRFTIDAVSGLVRVADGTLLDRELAADHDIVVRATSADGSSSTRSFTVDLTDIDEFDVGPVSDSDGLANSVAENAANGTLVGITATASDADATDNTITYALDDDAGGRFAIDPASGIVRVANGLLLDRESVGFHTIMVRASSTDGSFATNDFMIVLADLDEFDVTAPVDLDPDQNSVESGAVTGTATGLVAAAADADATTNTITYSLDDDAGGRFAIDAVTGAVRVADGSLLDADINNAHTVTVRATSADGSFSSTAFVINVTAPLVQTPPPPPLPPTEDLTGHADDAGDAMDDGLSENAPAHDDEAEPDAVAQPTLTGKPSLAPAAAATPPAAAPPATDPSAPNPNADSAMADPPPQLKATIVERTVDRIVGGLADLGLTELNRSALVTALDRAFSEMKVDGDTWHQLTVQISVGSSVALTTGFVAWVLRGGALASALLATLPAWRGFDPLPIIMNSRSDEAEEDVNGIDEMFDRVATAIRQSGMDAK